MIAIIAILIKRLVLHQMKDMPPQNSAHSVPNNRKVSHGPSFCKIPCDGKHEVTEYIIDKSEKIALNE